MGKIFSLDPGVTDLSQYQNFLQRNDAQTKKTVFICLAGQEGIYKFCGVAGVTFVAIPDLNLTDPSIVPEMVGVAQIWELVGEGYDVCCVEPANPPGTGDFYAQNVSILTSFLKLPPTDQNEGNLASVVDSYRDKEVKSGLSATIFPAPMPPKYSWLNDGPKTAGRIFNGFHEGQEKKAIAPVSKASAKRPPAFVASGYASSRAAASSNTSSKQAAQGMFYHESNSRGTSSKSFSGLVVKNLGLSRSVMQQKLREVTVDGLKFMVEEYKNFVKFTPEDIDAFIQAAIQPKKYQNIPSSILSGVSIVALAASDLFADSTDPVQVRKLAVVRHINMRLNGNPEIGVKDTLGEFKPVKEIFIEKLKSKKPFANIEIAAEVYKRSGAEVRKAAIDPSEFEEVIRSKILPQLGVKPESIPAQEERNREGQKPDLVVNQAMTTHPIQAPQPTPPPPPTKPSFTNDELLGFLAFGLMQEIKKVSPSAVIPAGNTLQETYAAKCPKGARFNELLSIASNASNLTERNLLLDQLGNTQPLFNLIKAYDVIVARNQAEIDKEADRVAKLFAEQLKQDILNVAGTNPTEQALQAALDAQKNKDILRKVSLSSSLRFGSDVVNDKLLPAIDDIRKKIVNDILQGMKAARSSSTTNSKTKHHRGFFGGPKGGARTSHSYDYRHRYHT